MNNPSPAIDAERDFRTMLDLMMVMIDKVANTPIPKGEGWMNDAQILATKLFKQACSINVLLNTTRVQMQDGRAITFIDHASVTILSRACIETFIVFHWIFQSQDAALRKFRHGVWRLGGLMDRLSLHPSTDQARAVIKRTRTQVAELLPELEFSPYLQAYTPKQAARLLKGDWRIDWSWTDEAVRAGFHKQYFENVYGHFCGYAHSTYISSMQIGQAQSEGEQRMLGNAALQACVHVMAHFIKHHAELFPPAKEVLMAASENSRRTLSLWSFTSSDMAHVYDQGTGSA